VGKPNVGKSSLFNRIVCDNISIVHPQAGVTRDRVQEYGSLWLEVKLLDHPFYIEDTPGLDLKKSGSILKHDMIEVVRDGIEQADLVFFVVDSLEGVTKDDQEIAGWLRSNFNFRYGSDRDEMLDQNSPIRMEGSTMYKTGIMPTDEATFKPEKAQKKKLLRLVANKADEEENLECMHDLYRLKMGDPIFVSAKQGSGMVASDHTA